MIGLTKRQSECLRVIAEGIAARGFSPTMRQIADALYLKSQSSAARLVNGLEERGAIRRMHHKARAIEVVEPSSITLNPEIARLVRSYAEQEGIKTDTAVNELLRGCLGAAA